MDVVIMAGAARGCAPEHPGTAQALPPAAARRRDLLQRTVGRLQGLLDGARTSVVSRAWRGLVEAQVPGVEVIEEPEGREHGRRHCPGGPAAGCDLTA
ncbi:MAG: hypothetical protein U0838_10405 [Chloroflexota bacterium]